VRFYATTRGREPVREWLAELEPSTLRAVSEDLRTVQIGWPLGMPLVRKLEPDLWEIRSSVRAGIVRVLFTIVGAELVLLHAFVKKSQAMPKDEMDLARKRMKECQRG
jgi:phage-related protein